MATNSTVIIIDDSIKMQGSTIERKSFYLQAIEYLLNLVNEENSRYVSPDFFSNVTLCCRRQIIPVNNKEDYIRKVNSLSKNLSISFSDQLPHWKEIVENVRNQPTAVCILTARLNQETLEWYYNQHVNVSIVDFSGEEPEPYDVLIEEESSDKETLKRAGELVGCERILEGTVVDFGRTCTGNTLLKCIGSKTQPKTIRNIQICGTTPISKVERFRVNAAGTFHPNLQHVVRLDEEHDCSNGTNVPNGIFRLNYYDNRAAFETLFQTLERMSAESNEKVLFFGKAECLFSNKIWPVLIKTSSDFSPVAESSSTGREADYLKPHLGSSILDDNFGVNTFLRVNGVEKTLKVLLLYTSWPIFEAFAKRSGLLLPEEDLGALDEKFPDLVFEEEYHSSTDAMNLIIRRMADSLQEIPDRTSLYEKEVENMSQFINLTGSRSFGLMVAETFLLACERFADNYKHIASETAKHFVGLAEQFN